MRPRSKELEEGRHRGEGKEKERLEGREERRGEREMKKGTENEG